jgi:hypothetical protein
MRGRSLIRGTIIGLVVPTVLLLASATASASCGGYVHILPAGTEANGVLPTKAPCHGPNCQDAPRHPPIPAPISTPTAPTHDVVLTDLATIETTRSNWWPSELAIFPQHVPSSIFHPPRS